MQEKIKMIYTDPYNRAYFYLCSKYPTTTSSTGKYNVLKKNSISDEQDVQIFRLMSDFHFSIKVQDELETLLDIIEVPKSFDNSK